MSDDHEDAAKMELLRSFYVPRSEYDETHRNVELRLNDLRRDVDGYDRRVTVVESRIKDAEIEQNIAKAERIGLLAIAQALEHGIRTIETEIITTSVTVRKIEHLQMLGWAIVGVLVVCVLIKVW